MGRQLSYTVRRIAVLALSMSLIVISTASAVLAGGDPPRAFDSYGFGHEDQSFDVWLSFFDPEFDPLTFIIVTPPSHGSVALGAQIESGQRVYTPDPGFFGDDTFTFKVNVTDGDTAVGITLTGSDADGDALTYLVVSGPDHGTLSGTAPDLTYTPDAGYVGADAFTFVVNDGTVDSVPATVSITVNEVGTGCEATIDIAPRSKANVVELSASARVRVAIPGSPCLDVRTVDLTSVEFGPAGATTRKMKLRDVDKDGMLDRIGGFSVLASGLQIGDTEACFAFMAGGISYMACDKVVVKPPASSTVEPV